jgi:glycerol uptake facilitator-like aquaporin
MLFMFCAHEPVDVFAPFILQFSVALDASVCNPATIVGLWVIGKIPLSSLIYSIISQGLGAIVALPILQLAMGPTFVDVYELGPSVPKDIDTATAFASEMMIGVYMLVHLAASSYADNSSRVIRAVTIAAEAYTYVLIGAASCKYSGEFLRLLLYSTITYAQLLIHKIRYHCIIL